MLRLSEGKKAALCVLLFLVLLSSRSVMAHGVVAAVYAIDGVVEGEIGFSNGKMARDVQVEIFAESGEKLGELRTDANGFFTYRPPSVQALSFRADLSAGHIVRVDLAAEDLSAGLFAAQDIEGNAGQKESSQLSGGASLRRDIINLRKDIAAFRAERRFQDILGGIGFIFGFFGIAAFVMGRKK